MSPADASGSSSRSLGVGVGVVELADQFLDVAAGVVRPRLAALQRAGVDAEVEQLAVRVGDDLEHQAAERLLRVGLALLFLVLLLRVDADDRRPVERAGQILGHRVEQRLDADVLAAGAAQHRLDVALERLLADHGADRLGRDRPCLRGRRW